jgi:CheY-like chemotaxis protein
MRLLYVEDNRINALLFEEMVHTSTDIEIEIDVAEDGEQALRLACERRPDVLVIDAHLPDRTGFELLPELRALPGLAAVPAFMCSADAMADNLAAANKAGFDGYWAKPLDLRAVLASLTSLAAKLPNR